MVQISTLSFHPSTQWSAPLPGELDGPRTLVLAFFATTIAHEPSPLRAIAEAFPRSVLAGCSTAGEVLGSKILDDGVVCLVARFEHVDLSQACVELRDDSSSFVAGQELSRALRRDDLRAVLVLGDGLEFNGAALVRGLHETLPPGVSIAGGMAADGDRFQRTYVLEGGEPRSHRVIGVGLHGSRLSFRNASGGGWDVFGLERRITRSEGSLVLELDGRPALDLYREYLGERAQELPGSALLFPLAIRPGRDQRKIVRSVLAIDEQRRGLRFAAEMPQGWLAQLMRANFDRLVQGASDAAERVASPDESFGIAVGCYGRRYALGERTEEELEAMLELWPNARALTGFFSYGEISSEEGRCDFHNETMTVVLVGET